MLMSFAEKFGDIETVDLGYSRMSLIAQMDVEPEIVEKIIKTVSESKATKKETGELKKLIDAEIEAGRLVRADDVEPLLEKARKIARDNQKKADAEKINPAVEKVVEERNKIEAAYQDALTQIERLDSEIERLKARKPEGGSDEKELKKQLADREAELQQVRKQLQTVSENLKSFQAEMEKKATEKIETERAKLLEQIEKQYSGKLKLSEETAEKRLNEIVELQAQLADLKAAGNEIERLKKENLALKTALEEKSKLVQENQMLNDRIHALESVLKSVKKNTPKEKLLEVIQQVESMLHASA
jgi:DNA repair exonuclease SbcCD ATPase subunit